MCILQERQLSGDEDLFLDSIFLFIAWASQMKFYHQECWSDNVNC
jgi:hypothetical protein